MTLALYPKQQCLSVYYPNHADLVLAMIPQVCERRHGWLVARGLLGQPDAEGDVGELGLGRTSSTKCSERIDGSFQDHPWVVERHEALVGDRVAFDHILGGGKEARGEEPSSGM